MGLKIIRKLALTALLLTVALAGANHVAARRADERPAPVFRLRSRETVVPFLFPPYPGTASEESIFDHTSPYYTQTDKKIVAYNGYEATKNCPVPSPPGTKPPQNGVCDLGYGIYWSYALGDWIAYNGHDGIDYGISYRPVYAAADADRVVYAGWHNPQDHRYGLGLYVRLHHANGYETWYGHTSAVAVSPCSGDGCAAIPHGEMIAISGNTGNSSGPHLHLRVMNPSGRAVDPYGWSGSGTDPWPFQQPESLWVSYPKLVVYSGKRLLPSGSSLPYPPAVSTGILVDDGDQTFAEIPSGCWNRTTTAPDQSQNGDMLYYPAKSSLQCTAKWKLPFGSQPGQYALYVRVPSVHATTHAAIYTIRHAGRSDSAQIEQVFFPNRSYVTDGWVYIGRYDFLGQGGEYVQVTNRTQDESGDYNNVEVGADAVRFVYLDGLPPTVTPSVTPTASTTPTITPTPTITGTPTPSRTPTITNTPTPSRTPTATRTKPPTATRWPSPTPVWTKIPVYFADNDLIRAGTPPYEASGVRWARTNARPETALREYFKGPGATERYWGYIGIYNGFTGYSSLEIANGVAHVYLSGPCIGDGSNYTIVNLLNKNLKQFEGIDFVKVYDAAGSTQHPDGASDSSPACLSAVFVPSPTFTATPTLTRTPTHTPTPTRTAPPTHVPTWTKATIYFANKYKLNAGTPPYEATGVRWARTSELPGAILNEYFKGPGATERWWGYISLYNGFTGYNQLEITDGVAHVRLTGHCQATGDDYTIVDLLYANLKQLPEIDFVKVYDADGETAHPQGRSDSAPSCLAAGETSLPPTPTPTPTGTGVPASVTPNPATFTPTSTPSRTPAPTSVIRPTATREWIKATIYFAHRYRMLWDIPPYEVTGVRWARTAELPYAILNEYFKGPGAYERQANYLTILDGFSGYSKLEITGGVARVYLLGECQPEGYPYTIADLLNLNLKQLPEINFVKVYDAAGNTRQPDGASDSIPACLQ